MPEHDATETTDPTPATHPLPGSWLGALSGLGHGLLAWSQPGDLDVVRPLSSFAEPGTLEQVGTPTAAALAVVADPQEDDLLAALLLDQLPDDPSASDAPAPLVALEGTGTHEAPSAPDEPTDPYFARRHTVAMLEEIAFLDE